ncbi:L-arabinokinase [Camellia lanceoleosa]|uniref:L-arabinokinase n=1 Tax=Camellia lanceoleosa TaxID=1840588 RepID=A0ACC0FKT5_9ERIC|nr:L-arabinokinase [Camellia lanceoleosa]
MRIEDGSDQVSASTKHLVFAYYVTGHGFGHATRVVEVVRHLILAGHDVHVVTGAPDFVFTTEIQSPRLFLRKLVLDCGAVQADALTVDRLASLEKYSETAVKPRDSILATEVEWLNSIKADLVVSDVVPVACRAAADAGIRSVCVTNFSWDFIYAEYVMAAGNHHRSIVWQIAEDYSHCEFLIRLPGYCPMPAFRDAIDVPLVVRRFHKSRKEARKELGIGEDVKLVILNFGGQPAGWKLKEEYLPSGWLCLVCGASDNTELPPNFIKLARDVYTPDVIAASDCMLGKIGYGTVSEALAYKLPFIFVRRDYFNEEPFLRNMLEYFQGGVEMIRRDLLTGQWKPYLERAVSLKPCYEGGINGGEVAARILQDTAVGKNYASDKLSGARRLRDAIVLGYQLQRVPGRDLCIPDWYANAENELGRRTGSPTANMTENSFHMNYTEDFEILHGDLQGLQDTMNFLNSLAELDAVNDSGKNTEKPWMQERMAAAGIFNWEEEIFVARAPGRLDVVGGIADYSGSLVLQMPIREACHVAVQRNDPSKQRLWKHAQSRQNAKGQGSTPVLQIVSYGSELSNRSPTFDMDLSDFMDGEQPISYQKAKEYFARDPSQRWAAYVAGVILVLMTELGVRFKNSISMLVSSAVPEGKGVSSSASVEVASMSAIAAAHGDYNIFTT